ncbi:MAG TPA: ABC transporter permease [Candidatus Cybelea sp.]|nr:ABC transporter permease [Candidatus Cybelea sp.]
METAVRDLRYGLRTLAKTPAFSALAIVTLALGIGANTAIFSVASSVLLRPLAYKDPGHLVRISTKRDGSCCLSLPYVTLLADTNHSFSGVAAYQYDAANVVGPSDVERVEAERVSGNFFQVLGVAPLAGRAFTPAEDQPAGQPVLLVGYELAGRLFGNPRNAVGQHLAVNAEDYTVIGVLPRKFGVQLLGRQAEIWMTRLINLSLTTPARVVRGGMYYETLGRLRPGVTPQEARVETEVIFDHYKRDKPGNFDSTSDVFMTVSDLESNLVANVRPTLLILSAAVGFLLLIACANVASLLLFRALGRRKEFALRSALGAPRSVLVGQLLTESVLMGLLSGVLGVLLGYLGTRFLGAFTESNLPQLADIPMDSRVLAFTFALSVLSGIAFGLAPSIELSRPDLATTFAEEGRGSAAGRRRNRARSVLVTAQVALSMVLLIGSGLLIRSFVRLREVNPGFRASHTLTAQTFLAPTTYPGAPERIAFYEQALRRLQAIPGVESVAISTALPVVPTHSAPVRFEGQPDVELGRRPIILIESISPDYPRAIGVRLVRGRSFEDGDNASAAPVAMVNEAAVRRFWPQEDPSGKLIWIGDLPPFRVVGVLGDVKNDTLASPTEPEAFFSLPQFPFPLLYLSLRAASDPRDLASALRTEIAAVNKGQPVTDVETMEERLESGSAPTRSMMFLIGVFSATALVLTLVGIYGLISYSVAQRKQELGIRMALGASHVDILRLIVGNGLRLAVAGMAVGLAVSYALTRLMATVLFDTSSTDPTTFALSAIVFVAVAALSSYLPARRALRISPGDALRSG